jgi:pimeloyl-ACP methyl ester carboxylesterase
MAERRMTTEGATLRVVDTGAGKPALVFLHYWGGSAATWRLVIDQLAPRQRCIAIDQRGWGQSIATDRQYDLYVMADDVQAVVTRLRLRRFVLVGHSMGGKVAQLFAARQPMGLAGIVLVAPAPPVPMRVPARQRSAMCRSYGSREGVLEALEVLTVNPLPQPLREQVITDTLRGTPGAKLTWTELGMTEDISVTSRAITVPVLVVVGDGDQVEREGALRAAFQRLIPQTRFKILPGVGHLSPLEAPRELAGAVEEFLRTL